MMRIVLTLALMLWPALAPAQEGAAALARQIERDAEGVLEDVSVIILGYGTGGAMDCAALENLVALERADARALGFRRLQGADLDGDGAIAGAEMRAKAAASSAAARGRLMVYFAKADGDGDDLVSAPELQTYANAVALSFFSPRKEAQLYALMGLDADGDGRVTLDEARAAIGQIAAKSSSRKAKGGAGAAQGI